MSSLKEIGEYQSPDVPPETFLRLRKFLLCNLVAEEGKRLPGCCVEAYAHYFTLQALVGMVKKASALMSSSYFTQDKFNNQSAENIRKQLVALIKRANANNFFLPKAFEPEGSAVTLEQKIPSRILLRVLNIQKPCTIPASLGFDTLFTDLAYKGKLPISTVLQSQQLDNLHIRPIDDFPLRIEREKFFQILANPTPEAAEMLALVLRENMRKDAKGRKKLNEISQNPQAYLDKLAASLPASAHESAAPAEGSTTSIPQPEAAQNLLQQPCPVIDTSLVTEALAYLHSRKKNGSGYSMSPGTIAEAYNRARTDGRTGASAPIITALLKGRGTENNPILTVAVANILLPDRKEVSLPGGTSYTLEPFTTLQEVEAFGGMLREVKAKLGQAAGVER